jgi:radical SAM protein with 4Fe4S-binding SPASM domain
MTPSATPLITPSAIRRLKESGLHRLAVSLDGADAATHDDFRRVTGSFSRTLRIIDRAGRVRLPVQVNTTVGRHNVHQLEQVAQVIARRGVVLWSIFFIVPTGRATQEQRLDADEVEATFERIHRLAGLCDLPIKTTEAPHYRRYVLQQLDATGGRSVMRMPGMGGTNDGKGILFISHTGEIYPSGFLPIACGRAPLDSVVRVYQDAALFRALRDVDRLGGKCGRCEFRHVCGGSRARAYAVSGDPLSAEPDCAYEPPPRPQRSSAERESAAGPPVRGRIDGGDAAETAPARWGPIRGSR